MGEMIEELQNVEKNVHHSITCIYKIDGVYFHLIKPQ